MAAVILKTPAKGIGGCYVCFEPTSGRPLRFRSWTGHLCDGCVRIARRRFNARRGRGRQRIVPVPSKAQRIEALRSAWDERASCFRCAISGVRLTTTDSSSPLYLTLDHSNPSSAGAGWLVVAAAINDMKSDMDVREFRRLLPLLGRLIAGGGKPKDRDRLETLLKTLRHWRRVVRDRSLDSNAIPSGSASSAAAELGRDLAFRPSK
jgi:hypothetical protein